MRLVDYVFGQRFVLRTTLTRDRVQERIDAATISVLNPFSTGVTGWSRFGRISLRAHSGVFDYSAKPLLVGKVQDIGGWTELDLRFRGPRFAVAFFCVWYLLLGSFALALLDGSVEGDEGFYPVGLPIMALMLLAPAVMHVIGTRKAGKEREALLDFLQRVIDARIVS